jgi:hypothetical protein
MSADELEERLAAPGWKVCAHPVGWRFFYATGHRLNKDWRHRGRN